MKIDLSKVCDFDVSFMEHPVGDAYHLHQYNVCSEENDGMEHGEHYKFLAYLASLLSGALIIDGGTRDGHSALALAHNTDNRVRSYDLEEKHFDWAGAYNLEFIKKNLLHEDHDILLEAELIFVDLDPHDGKQETEFMHILRTIGYKGILVFDDISTDVTHFHFPGMRKFWDDVPERKFDATRYGHGSGTGIVIMGDVDVEIVE